MIPSNQEKTMLEQGHIKGLDFCHDMSGVSDEYLLVLAQMQKRNPTLESLKVDAMYGQDADKNFAALIGILAKNDTLRVLKTGVEGPKTCAALTKMLATNKSLRELDFSYSLGEIGDKDIVAMAAAEKKKPKLLTWNLTSLDLTDQAAFAIADMLETHPCLTGIDLCLNKIGPKGAEALAKALKENPRPVKINLRYNQIGSEGGRAFADMLGKNAVAEVDLGDIRMDAKTIDALLKAQGNGVMQALLDRQQLKTAAPAKVVKYRGLKRTFSLAAVLSVVAGTLVSTGDEYDDVVNFINTNSALNMDVEARQSAREIILRQCAVLEGISVPESLKEEFKKVNALPRSAQKYAAAQLGRAWVAAQEESLGIKSVELRASAQAYAPRSIEECVAEQGRKLVWLVKKDMQ